VTKQRMVDSGAGCDWISVASPPLHHVPIFISASPDQREKCA
jgi:hypothetical protein